MAGFATNGEFHDTHRPTARDRSIVPADPLGVPEYESAECVASPAGAGLPGVVQERSSLDVTGPAAARRGAIRATGRASRTVSWPAAPRRESVGDFRRPQKLDSSSPAGQRRE